MRDLGAIATIGVIVAVVIVAMWRQILILCVVVCLAIVFAATLEIASGANRLLTRSLAAPALSAVQTVVPVAPATMRAEGPTGESGMAADEIEIRRIWAGGIRSHQRVA